MTTPEQQAREMLERMGIGNVYERMSAGELVELANLIAENTALKAELERVKAERDDWGKRWHQERRKVAELRYPGMTGVVKPMAEELEAIQQGEGEPAFWLRPPTNIATQVITNACWQAHPGLRDEYPMPLYTRPCVPLTDEPELLEALKRLSFAAQTTGGVAGRDEGLCAAIDAAAAVIAKVVAHTKGAKG